MTAHSPISTPGRMVTLAPNHASSWIITSFEISGYILINLELLGEESVIIVTRGPMDTRSPNERFFRRVLRSDILREEGT